MSRMPIRFVARWYDAFSIASQTEPSATSESPISTQMRPGSSSIAVPNAMPSPMGSPWPREPVATSTHGMSGRGTGCPSRGLPNVRNVSSCSSVIAPIAFSAEYSERRGMSLRQDEPIASRMTRLVDVQAKVVREEHGGEVGGRHRRRRVPGSRGGGSIGCCPPTAAWRARPTPECDPSPPPFPLDPRARRGMGQPGAGALHDQPTAALAHPRRLSHPLGGGGVHPPGHPSGGWAADAGFIASPPWL